MKFCVDVVSIRRRGAANRVIAQSMRIAIVASICRFGAANRLIAQSMRIAIAASIRRRGVANRFMATFIALGDPFGTIAWEIGNMGDMVAET